jgi:hypothetical protein
MEEGNTGASLNQCTKQDIYRQPCLVPSCSHNAHLLQSPIYHRRCEHCRDCHQVLEIPHTFLLLLDAVGVCRVKSSIVSESNANLGVTDIIESEDRSIRTVHLFARSLICYFGWAHPSKQYSWTWLHKLDQVKLDLAKLYLVKIYHPKHFDSVFVFHPIFPHSSSTTISLALFPCKQAAIVGSPLKNEQLQTPEIRLGICTVVHLILSTLKA